MGSGHVIVVGAGIGGLATALSLANAGAGVTVVFPEAEVGGKMRVHRVGGHAIDAGPTVLTMRWVFEELFSAAGHDLADEVPMTALETLGRHLWPDGRRLDLYTNAERSEDAIGVFAGSRAAKGFRRFVRDVGLVHQEVEEAFLRGPLPTPATLIRSRGLRLPASLVRIDPVRSMWRALGGYFEDPALRQLFGRYATYVGGSPFQTPATYNLIFHIEQAGVWSVDGGMHALARGMRRVAEAKGVRFLGSSRVAEIVVERGRARGVVLDSGERLEADAVCSNAGSAALATGALGSSVRHAARAAKKRSLSAVTFSMSATTSGMPLDYHNVFFSPDYRHEFQQLTRDRVCPDIPTTYVCARSRPGAPEGPEPLFCLTNAPARADDRPLSQDTLDAAQARMLDHLAKCGLSVDRTSDPVEQASPKTFAQFSPGSGGAIYGGAPHGLLAPFARASARSRVRGLYLCGGDCHPGAGVPMVALSGRQASLAMLADGVISSS